MVEKIKQDDKFRSLYLSMNLHDFDIREEGIQQGIEQGIQQGAQQQAIETAVNMLKKKKYPVQEIAELTGLPLQKVLELQQTLLKKA